MKKQHTYGRFARFIEIFHLFFIPTYMTSAYFVLVSNIFRIYAATFISIIWLSDKLFKGCLLTKLENRLLKRSGKETYDHIFLERALRKYTNKDLKFPLYFLKKVRFVLFIISATILFRYFFLI